MTLDEAFQLLQSNGAEIIQLELLLKKLIRAAEGVVELVPHASPQETYLRDVIATAKAHLE